MWRSFLALFVCAVSFLFLFSVSSRSNRHPAPPAVDSVSFSRDTIAAILSHPRCTGLRVYYGLGDDDKRVVVLVGVDRIGNDILDGAFASNGSWCPPICGGWGLPGQTQ